MRSLWCSAAVTIYICSAIPLISAGARADEDPPVDCAKAVAQMDLNICADRDFSAADKELNAEYKKARAAMVATDAELDDNLKGAEKALLKAQRAWLDYRDGECEAEGFQARGAAWSRCLFPVVARY